MSFEEGDCFQSRVDGGIFRYNLTDHLSAEHVKWKEVLLRAKSKTHKGGAMDKFLKPSFMTSISKMR